MSGSGCPLPISPQNSNGSLMLDEVNQPIRILSFADENHKINNTAHRLQSMPSLRRHLARVRAPDTWPHWLKIFWDLLSPSGDVNTGSFARWFGTMIHSRLNDVKFVNSIGTDRMSGKR